ncbi:MAG: UDP-N-acetylmuramate--L-alanine ligase [Clostridia bacterium]|nr:UDP-N-acetylmuramate--L-alanine ligase [Clostridia bacterium]
MKIDLSKYKKIYFLGIGGISMSALALILHRRGYTVCGYDRRRTTATIKLEEEGIEVFYDFSPNNSVGVDLCVYSAAIGEDNPEMMEMRKREVHTISRAQLLGSIADDYSCSIGISGTHGKSTTSGMLSQIFLSFPKSDPTILVGAELPAIHSTFRTGCGDSFIFEACEYKDSFLQFYPSISIVLNVELDHTDYFKDIDQITDSFARFIKNSGKDGKAIVNADSPYALRAAEGYSGTLYTYSVYGNGNYTAKNISFENGNAEFDVMYNGSFLMNVKLSVPGIHNVSNALAAIAASHITGVPEEAIKKGLLDFHGVCRRFEYKGTFCGVPVYDDYAHHPDEIKVTLSAARGLGIKRVIAVFEPHTYTRLHTFMQDFAAVLSKADLTIIAPIYAAREKNVYGYTPKTLADMISGAVGLDSFDEIKEYLKTEVREGDVILTMGAGDVTELAASLTSK